MSSTWPERLRLAEPGRLGLTAAKLSRDVLLLLCGVLTLIETPASIQDSSLHGFLASVWSVMLIVGAVLAAAGVLRHLEKVEIYGCAFIGAALIVWGVAAVTRPDATLTSWAVATLCWAGTAGQLYRIFGIVWVAGLTDRTT